METLQIDGRSFPVSYLSIFRVQVATGKGAYRDRYIFSGGADSAIYYYKELTTIQKGSKKRLLLNGKVIHREAK